MKDRKLHRLRMVFFFFFFTVIAMQLILRLKIKFPSNYETKISKNESELKEFKKNFDKRGIDTRRGDDEGGVHRGVTRF